LLFFNFVSTGYAIGALIHGLLLRGAITRNRGLLIPFMICCGIGIVALVIGFGYFASVCCRRDEGYFLAALGVALGKWFSPVYRCIPITEKHLCKIGP
jgi:biotin transporter BioY